MRSDCPTNIRGRKGNIRKSKVNLIASVLLLGVFAFSLKEQVIVNNHRFFLMHQLEGYFSGTTVAEVDDYFKYHSHADIISDFKNGQKNITEYYPLKMILAKVFDEQKRQKVILEFREFSHGIATWNQ
jgi:hypothetical protein